MKLIKRFSYILPLIILVLLSGGCIKKIALKKVAGVLTAESGTVFSGDDDPQLIADALPFALKTYESLLQSMPNDVNLLLATGKAYCMYSYAFIHSPADTISDVRIEDKNFQYLRAKKMYLRARGYLLRALEIRHPGFNAMLNTDKTDSALAMTAMADTSLLYWTGASWMGAFTTDKFDMRLTVTMPVAVAFMNRLLEMKENYGGGSIHDFFISYYGSMPASMGGSERKAREHFARSMELTKGSSVGTFVSLAASVCVGKQDLAEFEGLLNKALAVDINQYPANRLANTIARTKAAWLLKHRDNYFIIDDTTTDDTTGSTNDFDESDEEVK